MQTRNYELAQAAQDMWDSRYRSVRALQDATRAGLTVARLPPGILDHILTLQGGGAGGTAAATGVDNSQEYAKQPALGSPPHLYGLQRFIVEPPAAQIPITADALGAIRLPQDLRSRFTVASGQLARAVEVSLASPLTLGHSEIWTVITENTALLLALDEALPAGLRIGSYWAEGHGLLSLLYGFGDELLFVFSIELFQASKLTVTSFYRVNWVMEADG